MLVLMDALESRQRLVIGCSYRNIDKRFAATARPGFLFTDDLAVISVARLNREIGCCVTPLRVSAWADDVIMRVTKSTERPHTQGRQKILVPLPALYV
ncbi:hypothetical protein MRX96_008459 [Rhipicephalus microplus]